MVFKKTKIYGAFTIEIEKYSDERGFFARSYCRREFEKNGIYFIPVQSNIGYSKKEYTLRGLHYQTGSFAESKLVRCIKGKIYDVIVDLRQDSPTYKKWIGIELNSDEHTYVYVPKGCAHGYQTLRDETEIIYMVSSYYTPDAERGIRWNDPEFEIEWRKPESVIISEKDQSWNDFSII